MKRTGLLLIMLILLLTGCGGKENTSKDLDDNKDNSIPVEFAEKSDNDENSEGYVFEYNGTKVAMNGKADPILENLGEYIDYFEAESCAFGGLDKIYTYGGFELHTYETDGVDHVASVIFLDDSVSTKEGIYLYCGLDDVLLIYGDNHTKSSGMYTYELDKSKISFLVEDDKVVSIEYAAITE